MKVVRDIAEIREIIEIQKEQGKTIGLVPTMGALHKGHLSLIEESSKKSDYTIISIFVNPIQFGPNEDFEKYPRDLEKDAKLAESAGANLLFAPTVNEMLDSGLFTYVDIDKLSDNLCGSKRPGHFKGVCTIVTKLFNIITPNFAFFGKKDIQQLMIIKKMTRDLNFNIEIVPCNIVRETGGLAMSSRNAYLSEKEKKDALVLCNSLINAEKTINAGETSVLNVIKLIKEMIKIKKNATIDYVKIVNQDMEDVEVINNGNIIALAVFIGKTRLIDNHIIGEKLCY